MHTGCRHSVRCAAVFILTIASAAIPHLGRAALGYLSPLALAATKDNRTLFIACATANQVLRFDIPSGKVTGSFAMPAALTGLALAADGKTLWVTCAAPESEVRALDPETVSVAFSFVAGHTAMAPALSHDAKTLFVCNRFNNDVSVFDLASRKLLRRIPVEREPVAADLSADGSCLLVANHLHGGCADASRVAAAVTVIDTAELKVLKTLGLPDGSGSLNGLQVSPDGKYAVVTHILSRFRLPATQVERGWMNCNAITIIDMANLETVNTVLLDSIDHGAANPWGIGWSADSARLIVTHAGTHEISLIDFPATLAKLAQRQSASARADVPTDLAFLFGLRQRLKLPPTDLGPRAVAIAGQNAYIANYFSDSLGLLALPPGPHDKTPARLLASVPLASNCDMTPARKGEFYFHNADLCFQGWQSCATCHPGDARMDGLNWDLLNDGLGNPKNVKSLLLAHRTPPAMSMGVRDTAETAVRAGLRHILFTMPKEEVAAAMDVYLKSLKPVPSPWLVGGQLSAAARRGEKLFKDPKVGCAACHPPGLFTDLKSYNVGTRGQFDAPRDLFDTPTLVEVWRTAPYLHDGSAATMRDVLTTHNPHNRHGRTSHLTPEQLDDLATYVLSL
jgi:DNA-binding beta-propeller fold protein YncE